MHASENLGAKCVKGLMLIQFTKTMRLRLASTLALLYTLCVLAPAAAFAFGDGSLPARCLTDDHVGIHSVHVHEHHSVHLHDGKAHVHDHGTVHEPAKAPEHKADKECCGLLCLTALPAIISVDQNPGLRTTTVIAISQEHGTGRGPDLLYRPPIASLS
jgi:hypothetical protein